MPKIGRTLSYINTERKGKSTEQSSVSQSLGSSRPGGSVSMPQGDYLLKSIWDKVFEIRTDSQGTEYLFGKLPMVTQYGITMYSGDGVDIPSLASGLPFDGRTIWYNPDTQQIEVIGGTGGGSGEGVSNFWDLSGIPSWITNSKPKYTYSEIEGTPDLTQYALVSQIPSLSGYATESWVLQKNYATRATTLSGYGITDAYTKTNVDDLLKSYVTLGGTPQTITGEKNFTGGFKVNGSPIYYDTEKKYWKLEGDLLVTGGVTMYGNEGTFTPSTIMDAIAVDGTTISKSGGVLKVIGGTGGGVADSVAWANITGKPTWIGSSKPTYSYSEITGAISTTELQNYLTQNSYLNVTSGDNRYLKLSGGTLSSNSRSPLTLKSGSSENHSLLLFNRGSDYWGSIGFNAANSLLFKDTNGANYTIWHSGNDGSGSGLDADTLDGLHNGELKASILHSGGGSVIDANTMQFSDFSLRFYSGIPNTSTNLPTSSGYQNGLLVLPLHSNGSTAQIYLAVGKNPYFRSHHTYEWNEIAYKTDNVSSATKLQTARTIWGQSFDGTGNIDGDFTQTKGGSYGGAYGDNSFFIYNRATSDIQGRAGVLRWAFNDYSVFKRLDILGENIGTTTTIASFLDNGNVGIGTASPAYKLHVAGSGYFESYLSIGTASTASLSMNRTSANYIITPTSGYMVFCMGGNGTSVSTSNLVLYTHDVAMAMSGGNVGIGITSPSYKLDVNGGARFGSLTPADGLGVIPFAVANSSYANTGWCASFGTEKGGVLLGYQNSKGIAIIGASKTENICICPDGGNVGIGTTNPTTKFDINGKSMEIGTSIYGSGGVGSEIYMSTHREGSTLCARGMRMYVSGSATGIFQSFSIDAKNYGTLSNIMSINSSGNLLVTGGVTMYSDQRKKTILNHVELSLKQIAEAPLIEHYYNSDDKKTTHVGSIAQYWASMNDWFCKLDSEGYYTMEIQNAALASAISIARELDRYETKTDKAIKNLKKRICELEEEVERLKSA